MKFREGDVVRYGTEYGLVQESWVSGCMVRFPKFKETAILEDEEIGFVSRPHLTMAQTCYLREPEHFKEADDCLQTIIDFLA